MSIYNNINYGNLITQGNLVLPITPLEYKYLDKNYKRIIKDFSKDIKILEIGPGNTFFTQYLLNNSFKNIDILEYSEDFYNAQKSYFSHNRGINCINGEALEFLENNENKYDIIVMRQVIEHISINEISKLLYFMNLRLQKNGIILIETTNGMNPFFASYYRYIDITHKITFTKNSFEQFFLMSGIKNSDLNSLNIKDINIIDGFLSLLCKVENYGAKSSSIYLTKNSKGILFFVKKFFKLTLITIIQGILNIFVYFILFTKVNDKIIYTPFILFTIKNKNIGKK